MRIAYLAFRPKGWLAPVMALLLGWSGSAWAQAWVPPAGSGNLSLSYQYTDVDKHLFSVAPKSVDMGSIWGQTIALFADYTVWKNLAASAGATYLGARYSGTAPEGTADDGQWHSGFQDLWLGARYMIPLQGFAITPTVTYRGPLGNYATFGHTAIGNGLEELATGIAVGRTVSPWLPRLYGQLGYQYVFVEDHETHSLDENRINGSLGYFLTTALSLGGSFQHVARIDGIDWATDIDTQMEWHDHDVAAKYEYTRAGGWLNWSTPGALGLTASYSGTVTGENTHAGNFLTLAMNWGFSARRPH
jgi:predicted porin